MKREQEHHKPLLLDMEHVGLVRRLEKALFAQLIYQRLFRVSQDALKQGNKPP